MRRDTPSNAVGAHLGATCDRSRPSALLPGVCLHVTNPTHPGLGPVHPRIAGTQRLAAGRPPDAACVRRAQPCAAAAGGADRTRRSEEHTSELQSLMRISYA